MKITLSKAVVEKGGNVGYRQEGVRATVYFNKNMFADPTKVPDTITIEADGDVFTAPGAVKAGKELTPEQVEKQRKQAQAAIDRAAKAQVAAAKAQAKLDKLNGTAAQ